MPWDPSPAQEMQPDTPPPATPAEPIPVVATSADGVRVGVDIGPPLKAAIETAINDVVSAHPTIGVVRQVMLDRVFTDRALLHGASIDFAAASVATLATIVNPDSRFTAVAWVITACLAAKTLVHAGVIRAMVAS